MPDEIKEVKDVKKEEPKKKGILGKLKDATDDKEEQLSLIHI